MKRRGRLRNKTQQVMLNTVVHHMLAGAHSAPGSDWPITDNCPCLFTEQVALWHGISLWPVLVSCPSHSFLCSCFLGEHRELKTP